MNPLLKKANPATTAVNNAGSRTHNEDPAPLPEKRVGSSGEVSTCPGCGQEVPIDDLMEPEEGGDATCSECRGQTMKTAVDNHGNIQLNDADAVVNFIKANGAVLPQQLATQFGCSHEQAYEVLKALRDAGRLGIKQMRFYVKPEAQLVMQSKLFQRKNPPITPFQEQSSGNFKEAGPQGGDINQHSKGDFPELRKSGSQGSWIPPAAWVDKLKSMGFTYNPNESGPDGVVYNHPDPELKKQISKMLRAEGYVNVDNREYRTAVGSHANYELPGADTWVQVGRVVRPNRYTPVGTSVGFHKQPGH